MAGSGKKHRDWWSSKTPEQRAEIKRRQHSHPAHHYNGDLACPACGTDSSVGCIAGVV